MQPRAFLDCNLDYYIMASDCAPPPTYSPGSLESNGTSDAADHDEPQLLIAPTVDAINFQKGYLGADGERAAIEGELQIKGAELERWTKVSVLNYLHCVDCGPLTRNFKGRYLSVQLRGRITERSNSIQQK